MPIVTITPDHTAFREIVELDNATHPGEGLAEQSADRVQPLAALALEATGLVDTEKVVGAVDLTTVGSPDNQPPTRIERLPELERRRFDPSKAYLRLELYSRHNVFISPLSAFDVEGSATKYPLPVEFSMFTDRKARAGNLLGDTQSTAGQDQKLKEAGADVDGNIFNSIDSFLRNDQRGQSILEAMGIPDAQLKDLTPKETIYLIGYLMHELTSYQHDAVGYSNGHAPADQQNSMQILQNGLMAADKAGVKPLGVCRNFADVGEALFNAFKSRNMKLTNVYSHNATGFGGATTGKLHKRGGEWSGHAWLDFVAVGKDGHMAITTVDPTWTRRNGRSLAMYDMTNVRIGTHTRNILAREKVNYSSQKARNLDRITAYYGAQIDKRIDRMKHQHSGGNRLDLNAVPRDDVVLNSAMYFAIDFAISASEFGGSAFSTTQDILPKHVLTLIKFAAQQPDIIFSPAEYDAVRLALRRFSSQPDVVGTARATIGITL